MPFSFEGGKDDVSSAEVVGKSGGEDLIIHFTDGFVMVQLQAKAFLVSGGNRFIATVAFYM